MRILLQVALDTSSGYGNDGCGLARALQRLGHEVHLMPAGVTPPLPQEVAAMFTYPYEPPFDITVVHLDPMQLRCERSVRYVSRRLVAWTMWEFQGFHPRDGSKSALRKNLKPFDALVGYDAVTLGALDPHVPKSVKRLKMQGGFWSEEFEYTDRDWDNTFRYCMVGALHDRKDPFVAVRAFNFLREQYGDKFDAELHLKTLGVHTLHPMMEVAYPNLYIHDRWWPTKRLKEFYAQMHMLVAPSRGEGKNVPAMEAMATGMPVAATNWGGHTEWLRSEYAYPLPYQLTPDGDGGSARVDPNDLAEVMWHAYENRSEAREKGRLASRTIPAMCDWVPVARRFVEMVMKEVEPHEMAHAVGGPGEASK